MISKLLITGNCILIVAIISNIFAKFINVTTWYDFYNQMIDIVKLLRFHHGFIGGFVVALVTIFKKEWSPITRYIFWIKDIMANHFTI